MRRIYRLLLPGLCAAQISQFSIIPCGADDAEARIEILWPRNGQRLAPTLTPTKVRTRISGRFSLKDGYILVLLRGIDQSHAEPMSITDTLVSRYLNIEVFGLQPGQYAAQVVLVDNQGRSRNCWAIDAVSFSIATRVDEQNRSVALQRNLQLYHQGYRYNARIEDSSEFLMQPRSGRDFAYVTVLWSDDFVDNTIVWATGLRATGSSFRRICLIGRHRVSPRLIRLLQRCCCETSLVDPIQPPQGLSSKTAWRYGMVLTKLRIFQLDRQGVRKIVLMDADTLVLQNIDELFWLPAPSVTVDKDTLMGETRRPKLSAGIMTLEPDSKRFEQILEKSGTLDAKSGYFLEQDVLNAFFNHSYNILPMTYNLYPELLDVMPFLHRSQDKAVNSSMWPEMQLPMDNSIKVVHFWHLFNPFLIQEYAGSHNLQVNAKRAHKQMWRWYTIFWRLHQEGLRLGMQEEEFLERKRICAISSQAFGTERDKFVPVAFGQHCRHIEGLAWQ